MHAKKAAYALLTGGLLALYLGPAAMAAYNAPATIGAFTGDMTTAAGSYATTVSKFNGGTSFGSMAGQAASGVAITGGAINGTTIGATTPAAVTSTLLTHTGQVAAMTTITTGNLTLTTANWFVCVNKTTGAATTITGDASPVTGEIHVLKDCKGDAATNNITFTPTTGNVDGAASYVMNQPYQAVNVIYNGSTWSLF